LVTVNKLGQRTEERVHVFNSLKSTQNFNKAQGVKTLCLILALGALTISVPTPQASAQINTYSVTENNTGAVAQMEIRIQQLEEQIRMLTGKVEEQVYTNNKLKQDIKNLQNDMMQSSSGSNQSSNDNRPKAILNNDVNLDWKDRQDNVPSDSSASMQTSTSVVSSGDATALYESAYASLKNRDYEGSRKKFETFLREHPNHVLSANSKYWLGETYYVQGNFTQAAKEFAQGFQNFPDSSKSPDMLLKLGLSLSNTGKKEEACIALSQLPVRFKAGPQNILDRGVDEMDKLGCNG